MSKINTENIYKHKHFNCHGYKLFSDQYDKQLRKKRKELWDKKYKKKFKKLLYQAIRNKKNDSN